MKDKLKKKKKDRFDYDGFLKDKNLWYRFIAYLGHHTEIKSLKKAKHDFIKSRGLWYELTHSLYDSKFAELVRIAHTPWLNV